MLTSVVLTWIFFIPIAILNGLIRERVYRAKVGELAAHQISTVLASLGFVILSIMMLKNVILEATDDMLFLTGLGWVVMTILFEFGFGRYVDKLSWERLLSDYNILKGRVWGVFLLVEALSPYIVYIVVKSI